MSDRIINTLIGIGLAALVVVLVLLGRDNSRLNDELIAEQEARQYAEAELWRCENTEATPTPKKGVVR